ncbi:hypothetical protein DFW101_0647 [Solidesulfovibrio carbinoliphilus subsp. oakridgensis]|uniref:Uncharacterized protein n=1 Tax=Solidesulfovibrio carbinoliphilus subsp. oakridgensis TaxID=694327 RepID=G7QE08_9BACT|nr:hypothetical protein [Solidesulfovibrio carbinoliphilus]EHJ46664.1 hypothetical protein DFW101_0647 [Solidesulfovibrio carbinoliphilus subsp. oakridgensis]
MDAARDETVPAKAEYEVLVREGCRTLDSLGEKRLAREFGQRAKAIGSREELAALLLEFLVSRRSGRQG